MEQPCRSRRPHALVRRTALAVGLTALAVAGCTTSHPAPSTSSGTTSSSSTSAPSGGSSAAPVFDAQALQDAYADIVSRVLPSVVEITTDTGLGSGIVFDDQGNIVTNYHVIGGANSFEVRLATGAASMPATLVGEYSPDDLAVIRVSGAKDLRPAQFADSSKARVGDIVLAMGNPLGLSSSVTEGIISATGRTVTEPGTATSPGTTLPEVIQTSAAINPGNSGGALVDLAGQVVGIPTLAAQDARMGGAAPGIGFAVPSNIVKDIAGQLVEHGKVVNSHRAALGVNVVTVTNATGVPSGVGVSGVTPGGAAAAAGITAGDIITAVNGTAIPDAATLSVVLAGLKPGDQAAVSLTRPDGATATVSVTLGQLNGT